MTLSGSAAYTVGIPSSAIVTIQDAVGSGGGSGGGGSTAGSSGGKSGGGGCGLLGLEFLLVRGLVSLKRRKPVRAP